jgi:type VI secretion system protein ImpC
MHVLLNTAIISDDPIGTIKAMIAEIDRQLSAQVNLILHHERFQQVESAWRGLHYLVSRTETGEMLKIRVMDVSKRDLAKVMKRYDGAAWDQSPLLTKLYIEVYGVLGAEPYGCLVGDYYFDHSPCDVQLLTQVAQIAAAVHAPFIAAAAPSLIDMESWRELNARAPDSIRIPPLAAPAVDYVGWKLLRQSDDARYIGLAMPRFLARLPYGAGTSLVKEFEFEEETGGGDHHRYTWANSAYAMAVNINRAFKDFGWCTAIRGIESGGAVKVLPVVTFPCDESGTEHSVGPTEVLISDRLECKLADCGLMPLVYAKRWNMAAFFSAQSLQQPQEYETDEASAIARLSARLPVVFAASRFAQCLLLMSGVPKGAYGEAAWFEKYMNEWLQQYVLADRDGASDAERAARPLRQALVTVNEVVARPGEFVVRLEIWPHYPLDGMVTAYLKLPIR